MFRAKPVHKSLSVIIPAALMLIGALLLLVEPMAPAQAQDPLVGRKLLQDTTLSVDPSSAEVDVGDETTVEITIDDVTDLYYVEVYVLFDPELLEVVDADSASSGVQIEIGPFLGTDVTVYDNDVDQDNGEISFAQEVASDAVDGSGVLAEITFEGKASGTSDITIDDTDLYLEDSAGDPIDVSIENGTITIVADVTSSPTLEATSTSTSTLTATSASTSTLTATSTPKDTSTPTPKVTSTPTRTPTPGPTSTPAPTSEPTAKPTAIPEIKTRVLQVWPDRSIGVASGLLEGTGSYANTQVLPFGIFSPSAGEMVEARTYLHFPVSVFPLGTQVKRATLYVYVDSASSQGEAAFGTYRVLDPWDTTGWRGDPASWPTFLPAPIAITEVNLAAEEAMLPIDSASEIAAAPHLIFSTTEEGPAAPKLAMLLAKDSPLPTATSSSSVIPTPTATPSPSASPTRMPSATSRPGSTSTASPTLTRTPSTSMTSTPKSTSSPPLVSASTFELESTEGRWLMWDVTALLRAWLAEEVPDHGLALAAAVDSDSESKGELVVARSLTIDDPNTMPHIIADIEIHPVTPTPAPILPIAGDPGSGSGVGAVIVGAALLVLGLALAAWRGRFKNQA